MYPPEPTKASEWVLVICIGLFLGAIVIAPTLLVVKAATG